MSLINRRHALQVGLAAGLLWQLPQARACEFRSSNLRITHPWTRDSGDDATTAIVSMKFDEVAADDRLIGVETPVAGGAELGGEGMARAIDFAIPMGRETLMHERGTFVRLTDLNQPLILGRAYPMRLIFARGGAIAATLTVDFGPTVLRFG